MNIPAKSKKINKLFFLILISLGILSAIVALQPEKINSNKLNYSQPEQSPAISSPIPTVTPLLKTKLTKAPFVISTPTPVTQTPSPESLTPQSDQISQLTSTPNPSFDVNLSINGSSSFKVSVNEGATQCDILSKALEQNKITQLNMRYDKNYETFAVYQINGIGKENSVWWVYKVNGISPTKGCSFIKGNNNDNVLWEYKGS